MINNYLDWVKKRREWYARSALGSGREFREVTDAWSKGFYKGLAMAYNCGARDFGHLQKSLEEHIEYACAHSSPEVWERFSKSLLS